MGILIRLLARSWRIIPLVFGLIWAGVAHVFSRENLTAFWNWYTSEPGALPHTLELVSGALLIWTLFEAAVMAIRTLYQLRFAKDLVCLKITQPRKETEKDRQEATEKDFHEKVAIMEQLYRSIHEIGEMNLGNQIRSMLFHTDLVSFELFYGKEKIEFFVVTNKYYASVVEKQITSFYPDAYTEPVPLPDPAPAGKASKCFFFYQAKETWRPFKTHRALENDPLNALTNTFSKLKKTDVAAIQLVLRPEKGMGFFGGWQKTGRRELNDELLKKNKSFSIPGLGWLSTLFSVMVMGNDTEIQKLGTNAPGAQQGDAYTVRDQATDENLKHCGEKLAQPGFETMIRIVGSSDTEAEAEQITNSLATAFGMYKNDYLNWLENRRILPLDLINDRWMLFNFRHRLPEQGVWPLEEKSCLLVPEELASLYHIPESRYNYTPLIEWLKYKILPPPVDLPKEGILLGHSKYRGETKEVRISQKDRTRHFYIIGKSGSGKSVMLSFMAKQDIKNGDGCCVVDPHGDLIEDILNYVPKERAKDVIVFDPGDLERPMGLNMLDASNSQEKDFASLAAMSIFIKLFGPEVFGPRIQHYFRNGCLTLMDDEEEGATLIDIPRLFTDDDFSKYKLTKVKNPVVRNFWEREMAKTGQREKEEMIPYFTAKFGPFVTNTLIRNIIGQKKSAFDFRKIMDERKILLVNLSKGKVGDINSQLLGLIFVNKIQMAAMSRVDVPEDQRPNFWLYVDEFQNFATDAFASILSEARKYHLGLIVAHQYIGQLTHPKGVDGGSHEDPTIRDAVFGNVGTMLNFKIGAEDAEYMAKEYAPLLSNQDLINIANYSTYIKLNVNNTTSRPFSMSTIWDETGKNSDLAKLVKDFSRLKYGRKKEFVDAEICARIGIDLDEKKEGEGTEAADTAPTAEETNSNDGTTTAEANSNESATSEASATPVVASEANTENTATSAVATETTASTTPTVEPEITPLVNPTTDFTPVPSEGVASATTSTTPPAADPSQAAATATTDKVVGEK